MREYLKRYYSRFGMVSLLLVGASPSALLVFVNQNGLTWDQRLVAISASLFGLVLATAPYRRWPRTTIALLTVIAALALPELAFVNKYGWTIDANALSLVAETNPAEFADLVMSVPLSWLSGLLAIAALAALAWPLASTPLPQKWPGWRLGFFSSFGLICVYLLANLSGQGGAAPLDPTNPFPAPVEQQALALRGAYPTGLPLVIADYFKERHALAEAFKFNQKFRFGVRKPRPSANRRIYVLIIGETTRADRWGINGYSRDTTPHLARRPETVSFKRMYSASTFSRLAVPLLISRKPPGVGSATFNEASIVTAFKEAGFHTAWISLQAPVGFHESPISVHAYEADEVVFLNPTDYRSHGKFDGAAISSLRKILAATDRDTFVVIHTLGSHFRYTDRYPKKFSRFLPDRPADRDSQLFRSADKIFLSNAYDNTVAYIDSVLEGFIEELQARNNIESWIVYSSDHGEALFDDCRMLSGHGQYSFYTQSVAAIFWPSPLYARRHPDLVAAMRRHQTSLASTAMMFETLTALAGLDVPGNRPRNSLAGAALRMPAEVAGIEADRQICRSQGAAGDSLPGHR